jgi:hypothetical protein
MEDNFYLHPGWQGHSHHNLFLWAKMWTTCHP